jgi:SAM-dependent methyltransferase
MNDFSALPFGQSSRDQKVYQHIWADGDDRPPSPLFVEMIELAMKHAPDLAVADLGSGAGRHAKWAAQKGCCVDAIEYDDTALARQAAFAERCWNVTKVDVREWLPARAAQTYNCVVCFDAMHHMVSTLSQLDVLLAEIQRITKPGGWLLLTLLCDIHYSHGVVPGSRLTLSADTAEQFFLAFFEGSIVERIDRQAVRIARTLTEDGSGNLVESSYEAERVLFLVQKPLR